MSEARFEVPLGVRLIAVGLGLACIAEAATLWTALAWLDVHRHLPLVSLYLVRTVAYGVAALGLWRGRFWLGWALALACVGTYWMLYLSPAGWVEVDWDLRRFPALIAGLLLLTRYRRLPWRARP